MSTVTEAQARLEFAKHVATRSKAETHLGTGDVLEWAQPGHSNFRIVYTLVENTLHVHGDLGAACFRWYGKTTLEAIAGYGLSYFCEKCEASEYGSGGKEWSTKVAREELQRRIDEALDGRGECSVEKFLEAHDGDEDAISNAYTWARFSYEQSGKDHAIGIPGCSDNDGDPITVSLEESYDIGRAIGRRIQWHHWGLKLAIEQCERRLSENDERTDRRTIGAGGEGHTGAVGGA